LDSFLIKKLALKIKGFYLVILILFSGGIVSAQVSSAFYEGERISNVQFVFQRKVLDSLEEKNLEQSVKRSFPVFPQTIVKVILLDAYTNKVRRLPQVAKAEYEIIPSALGGINVILTVFFNDTLSQKSNTSGIFAGKKDFPTLFQDNKSLLLTKFAIAQMLYANNDAWYKREDAMLNGNPLADNPAGKGLTGWTEGWASAGLYGITTLSTKHNIYFYGGASYIVSGSIGQELFTNRSRIYGGFDDAFAGIMGTVNDPTGNRFTYNLSFGRQQFTIGKGFIVRNTASNGDNRGALQLNPRWAADFLGLAAARYNNILVQLFQLNPDELDLVDSKTLIRGVNTEWGDGYSNQVGFSFLSVPKSTFKYFTPSGDVFGRQGLMVFNLRYYTNTPPNIAGAFFRSEIGYQRNTNFKMASFAGYAELGWSFAKKPSAPSVKYRYAYFSGDNPNTESYERWDPLLSGGNGEEWVVGANHFKVVQNGNIQVHLLQANIKPRPKIELVPQIMFMYAATNNNIGGNPALSYLPSREYGSEINITVKYFRSRRWYWHGHLAYTLPGSGVRKALDNNTNSWFSAMLFFRYGL
jgi:hypothetical protein